MIGVLGYAELKQMVRDGFITNVKPSHIQPASIDLTFNGLWYDVIAQKHITADRITLHPPNAQYEAFYRLATAFALPIVHRPSIILAETEQKFKLPYDIAGDIKLRSTPSRAGLDVSMGGWVDPGFPGTLSLVMHTHCKTVLRKHESLCQIVFHRLQKQTIPYNGKYQGSQGPTPARDYDYT